MIQIAIPSYGRAAILNSQTLATLSNNNIPSELIHIFVTEEEQETYEATIDKSLYGKIIVGERGLVPQRECIERYFDPLTKIVCLDDDIKSISIPDTYPTLLYFFNKAFEECENQAAYIWGVYPVNNKFFYEKAEPITSSLKYLVGAFYGFINRPDDPELRLTICREGNKEDTERTLKYWMKDGKVIRFNHVSFGTKYFGRDGGGLGRLEDRIVKMKEASILLNEAYPFTRIKIRKNGLYEVTFASEKKQKPQPQPQPQQPPTYLSFVDMSNYDKVYKLLSNTTIKLNKNQSARSGTFGEYRGFVLGNIKGRVTRQYGLSAYSKKHPELYNAIVELGNKICPFKFDAIQVNHNVVCPRHLDKNNVGESVIVSVGEYEGCDLVIEDQGEYDTRYKPLLFNGSTNWHWNTPLISGTKYSLVYFVNPN